MTPRRFRYPTAALRSAYGLAVVGMLIGFGPLLLARPAPLFRWLLGAMGVLFLVYFLRTVTRQLTWIELDATGISVHGPLGAAIPWDALRAVRLNYYSTRPDRSGGWMEFILQGPRRALRVESTLDGFAELVRESIGQAQARGLEIDERTRANLRALGITL
ncbi:MAG TPA: hypothetical protein VLA41_06320 [Burkholderiales bacterium]|nr:hypothetical protein [Burkholderiales bacterium]